MFSKVSISWSASFFSNICLISFKSLVPVCTLYSFQQRCFTLLWVKSSPVENCKSEIENCSKNIYVTSYGKMGKHDSKTMLAFSLEKYTSVEKDIWDAKYCWIITLQLAGAASHFCFSSLLFTCTYPSVSVCPFLLNSTGDELKW